jgi:hypothetical protein
MSIEKEIASRGIFPFPFAMPDLLFLREKRLDISFQDRSYLSEAFLGRRIIDNLPDPELADRWIEALPQGSQVETVQIEFGVEKISVDFTLGFWSIHSHSSTLCLRVNPIGANNFAQNDISLKALDAEQSKHADPDRSISEKRITPFKLNLAEIEVRYLGCGEYGFLGLAADGR